MTEKLIWDEWAQRVYLTWLARDIRYAQVALLEIRTRAGQTPPDPLVWIPLETFLMFSAKVSKMLKPVGLDNGRPKKAGPKQDAYDRRKYRGECLRALLGVDDASPLLDRKVRDASEHFDERLDAWTGEQPRFTAEEVEAGGLPNFPPPPMRRVDSGWVVEVAGETLDLGVIEIELRRILGKTTELESLAALEDPGLATLLAGLPPFPTELRLGAPTRRPDKDVRTGIDVQAAAARQAEFDEAIARAIDAFAALDEQNNDEPMTDASESGSE
ncbi:hypothetical protein OG898_31815 [Streptomyces sp. NBC_00193]|uniref:hypothetical protein n=1 Tax=Streptomyces sp. NBC_00193 TaxID=2975675 RepID=UPI00224E7362|nr:hypothetical protein [Streptomyces sp. NBC_00193]MCX5301000.1 hypothetical protein [Streptomyces sp. NBC_00193]